MSYSLHYAKKYDVKWSENAFFNWQTDEFYSFIVDNCDSWWSDRPDEGNIDGVDKHDFISLRDKVTNDEIDITQYFKDEVTKETVLEFMNEVIKNGEKGITYFKFTWR